MRCKSCGYVFAITELDTRQTFDLIKNLIIKGGIGVIRGHTYSSKMREYPQLFREFNQTWWPDRHYNFKELWFISINLNFPKNVLKPI